ncbi:MAG: S-layer homology domain-containing protein [Gudongella sp.]|nr:S-layer homology domain-containing protein [Gudongella sp.]
MKKYLSMLIALLIVLQPLSAFADSFKDVKQSDWYYGNISILVQDGTLNGYPDKTFKPQNTITRAEFIKATMSVIGYDNIPSTGTHWADGYIQKGKDLGILCSYVTSNPDVAITRYDMSRIVSNLLTYQNYNSSVDLNLYENSLGDIAAISNNLDPVLKKSVLNSYASGILTGYEDGTFSGDRTLNRGEAATVLLRIKDAKYRAKPKVVSESSYQEEILALVNKERTSRGLNALVLSAEISKVAIEKSKDMAIFDYFSHESPNYGSPFDMMKKFGITYRAAGENIAMGYTTPADVMEGWMDSPGHKANILSTNFNKIGIGMYRGDSVYWTQQFTD